MEGISTYGHAVLSREELLARLEEAEETLRAIRSGGVDAVVVSDAEGPQVYTLQSADHTYRLFVQEMNDGALSMTRDGTIIYANPSFVRLVEKPSSTILGGQILDFVAEGYRAGLLSALHDSARKLEIELLTSERRVPVFISINSIQAAKVPLVYAVVTDLTEQKVREDLRKKEERLRLALRAGGMAAWDWDIGTGAVLWNEDLYRMLGYEVGLVAPSYEAGLARIHPEDAAIADETIRMAMLSGAEYQFECRVQWPEGTVRWIDFRGAFDRDSSGRATRGYGVGIDITERRRAEQQRVELLAKDRALESEKALRQTEAELARVVRALSVGELATSIAHEINQPLAGVITNAQAGLRWLSNTPPNIEEAKESFSLVARDGTRAGVVMKRVREFLGKGPVERVLLNPNDIVRDAAALAHSELEARQIALRTELSSELPGILGDRIQLQQVLLNLIMNGAEAMASIERSKELIVRSRKVTDGGVIVAVEDRGSGMNPLDMAHMFDPLFTTKPAGIGMGLSICRSIIEAHGGRIWAELNETAGLTVQFELSGEGATAGVRG